MKNNIITEIRQSLKENVDEKKIASGDRHFKEEIKLYGVKLPIVNRISKLAMAKLRDSSKQDVFDLCEELWKSGYSEEGHIACNLAYAMRRKYEPADFAVWDRWVRDYISNWATCDSLCNHSVGEFVTMYPEYAAELKKWALSANRWMRRAAAVTLIVPARQGLFLDDALEIADILLLDNDDLVQKGYGWMLKAASMSESFVKGSSEIQREHLEAVFDFVMARRDVMPRTALRYAVEKMPSEMRAEAMKK